MDSLNSIYFLLTVLAFWICTEAVLSPLDEKYQSVTADRYNFSDHPCRRTCHDNVLPLTCYYVFVVETYSSMTKACYDCPSNITDCYRPHCIPADGIQKPLYVVNRQMPGPTIEVCQGDAIVVDVRNAMLSESTTIHWHGFNQKGTPYMDGVAFVTQCPISPGQTFRYKFLADESGTYFWHSHMGTQRGDGLFGPMIICPRTGNDYSRRQYDEDEHRMVITDWRQISGSAAMIKQYHDRPGVNPTNILVNGWGRQITNIGNATQTNIPSYIFHVKKNKRTRFRLINAGSADCPIEIFIDNHPMTVISLDSNDIEPVEVDALVTWPGERVDFVINTNQRIGNYWIRYRGFGVCQNQNDTNIGVFQVAILRYEGAPARNPNGPIGYDIPFADENYRVLNPYQRGTEAPPFTNINIPQLNARQPNDASLSQTVDQQIFIKFDSYPLDNYDFHRKGLYGFYQVPENRRIGSVQLNHISNKMQSYPLLSQRNQIKPGDFCNENNILKNCSEIQCACTHVIPLKLNSVVELVFVDEGNYAIINHPLHLHGHFFRVVATEKLEGNVTVERIKEMDRQGLIRRRLDRAPLKDTMKAPGRGYTIVRQIADNPGYWLFHCHFGQHNNIGMSLIFKVGEHSDMPPVPRNFPTCGNYEPRIEDESQSTDFRNDGYVHEENYEGFILV